jgi:uncharacterized membrane protein YkgB
MNYLIKLCDRLGILRSEIDYHVIRASMVLIFLFFGYQKWFEYEAKALVSYRETELLPGPERRIA